MALLRTVLVLTLHSGEREFPRCVQALREQRYVHWEHRVLSDLPNTVAHSELYRAIMQASGRHDLFVKLDADMVLAHADALAGWVDQFRADPRLDHLIVPVHDFMTRRAIEGVHVFSRRARWPQAASALFPDPYPTIPGDRRRYRVPRVEVLHAPDPSPLQAFHYGVHRAHKAVQGHIPPLEKRADRAYGHWEGLEEVASHYGETGDKRLALALVGAQEVLDRRIPPSAADYTEASLHLAFRQLAGLSEAALSGLVAPWWRQASLRRMHWLAALGPAMLLKLAVWCCGRAIAARPERAGQDPGLLRDDMIEEWSQA